ncbi:MAG: DUF6223 family protein [Pyrinomonadaceae bacterium]
MKRTLIIVLVALISIALFAGLVHLVLVASNLSEPAATTVQGVTGRRVWATIAGLIGLLGVVVGGVALLRAVKKKAPGDGRKGAIVAVVAGLIAVLNGGLNLAVATGGPGTGNGVIGGAGALVLGLIAAGIGLLALARSRSADKTEI